MPWIFIFNGIKNHLTTFNSEIIYGWIFFIRLAGSRINNICVSRYSVVSREKTNRNFRRGESMWLLMIVPWLFSDYCRFFCATLFINEIIQKSRLSRLSDKTSHAVKNGRIFLSISSDVQIESVLIIVNTDGVHSRHFCISTTFSAAYQRTQVYEIS